MPRLHRESLLHVPLVRRALTDRRIRPTCRRVDRAWFYGEHLTASVTGFNPFAGRVFYAARSPFAAWRPHAHESARPYNPGDQLVRELWTLVHDYLHAWSYGLIRALRPQLQLGFGKIDAGSLEDFAFAHLVTEAAATVGLDYWYLSVVELDDVCPIGSTRGTFSTHYEERYRHEYRRARPGLVVQTPRFFDELAAFYCTGTLDGFSVDDMSRSPRLDAWLRSELRYGVTQRRLIRSWLRYLGGLEDEHGGDRPFDVTPRWRRALIREVGDALWALVKEDRDSELVMIGDGDAWHRRGDDPRFANLDGRDDDTLARIACSTQELDLVMDQLLARHDYARFDRDKLPRLAAVRARRDFAALRALLRGEPLLPPAADAIDDLLFVN